MPPEETPRQIVERMGPDYIRYLLSSGGLPTYMNGVAAQYLAEVDQAANKQTAEYRNEQDRIARSTRTAGWIAAVAAIAAALLTIVGIVVTMVLARR